MSNYRTRVINVALDALSESTPNEPLSVIEVGCMFNRSEGLSTLALAEFVSRMPPGSRFVCIEYSQENIAACRLILEQDAPSLIDYVDFRCGHSLAVLPAVLEELGVIHFASLDGGAQPEICLQEFELCAGRLDTLGSIVVDDVVRLKPYPGYPLNRSLGKATLILPLLILAQYMKHREQYRGAHSNRNDPSTLPSALSISAMMPLDFSSVPTGSFDVVGRNHRMLVYGDPAFIARALELEGSYNSRD